MRNTDSNGGNGRGPGGRFIKGNQGGPGNPAVVRLASWRATFEAVVTDDELRLVVRKLLEAAKTGEPWAVKELLSRTVPLALPLDVQQDLQEIKELLAAHGLIDERA